MNHNCRRLVTHPAFPTAMVSICTLLAVCSSVGLAQEPAANPPAESESTSHHASELALAAIRAGSEEFVAAFNPRDASAIARLWTVDGEFIDDSGRRIMGRDAIEKGYEQLFASSPEVTMRVMIDSVRLLSDGTAIEDGRAVVDPPPAGVPGYSKYMAIHVMNDGKWMMAAVRETYVETPSGFRNVADLEWLIGTWIAEEQGNKIESVCRWIANKSFVERRYTITKVDGSQTSGVQMIGWNALDGHVQSWDFSPDGGHAVGLWSPDQGGWTAEMRGVTGDGVATTSVNTLTRLDDNAYVWQSIQRTAGDVALPDTDEVVLKRQPTSR